MSKRTFEGRGRGAEPAIYVTEHPADDSMFRVMYRQHGIQRCIQDDIHSQGEAHAVRAAVVLGLNQEHGNTGSVHFSEAQEIAMGYEYRPVDISPDRDYTCPQCHGKKTIPMQGTGDQVPCGRCNGQGNLMEQALRASLNQRVETKHLAELPVAQLLHVRVTNPHMDTAEHALCTRIEKEIEA